MSSELRALRRNQPIHLRVDAKEPRKSSCGAMNNRGPNTIRPRMVNLVVAQSSKLTAQSHAIGLRSQGKTLDRRYPVVARLAADRFGSRTAFRYDAEFEAILE